MKPKNNPPEKGLERWLSPGFQEEHARAEAEVFLRNNPWLAVAGAALAGGVLSAISDRKKSRKTKSSSAVRGWLEEAYDNLPTPKQFHSMAKTAGVPTSFEQFKEKLSGEELRGSDV
jgi:hypothetical protein